MRLLIISILLCSQFLLNAQCACRCKKPNTAIVFCSEGVIQSNTDLGEDCSDFILDQGTGDPIVIVFTQNDTLIQRGSYPANVCDLWNEALPGNWQIEKLPPGSTTYKITYRGSTSINRISFGDDILGGVPIDMEDCN